MKLSRIAMAAAAALMTTAGAAQAEAVRVATTAIVEHPALDAVRDGVKEALEAHGYTGDKLEFSYESAQGNPAIAAQIARRLIGEAPDVIVAIATPSAQAAAAATKDIPVVFSAVTDPVAAKLVLDPAKPGGNVTGTSDMSPVDRHMDLIREILPNAKAIGVPFNPGEANAVVLVDRVKEEGPKKGFEIITAAAPRSADVMTAARSLIGKVDAIYVPTDNTIITALESVVKTGMDNDIPVFAADTDSVARGALAAMSLNYHDLGVATGEIVVKILQGTKPGDIAVTVPQGDEIHLNPKMAKEYGVTLPQSVVDRATKIVE